VNPELFRPKLKQEPRLFPVRSGLAHNAAAPWLSSNGSAPLNYDCGLRPPPYSDHDPIFLITTSPLISAPTPHVRPGRPSGAWRVAQNPPANTGWGQTGAASCVSSLPLAYRSHSKPIVRGLQTASFKRLYRKRPGAHNLLAPELRSPARPRYSANSYRRTSYTPRNRSPWSSPPKQPRSYQRVADKNEAAGAADATRARWSANVGASPWLLRGRFSLYDQSRAHAA
jgi:hypothetical protein